RGFDDHPAQQVTGIAAPHRGDTLAAQTEQLAGLGFNRNLQLHATFKGRHFELTTQRGIGKTDGHFGVKILAFAAEDGVITHRDLDIEVAGRTTVHACLAFTGQTDTVTGIDTGGNLHRQGFAFFLAALTVAVTTGVLDDLAGATTGRTGLLHREKALLHADLADAVTGGTGDRAGTFLGAGAVAGVAVHKGGHADFDGGTFDRFFQIQLEGVAQVGAAIVTATGTSATTEDIAEHIPENIAEAGTTETCMEATAARIGIDAGMPIAVVGCPLLLVRQDFVG